MRAIGDTLDRSADVGRQGLRGWRPVGVRETDSERRRGRTAPVESPGFWRKEEAGQGRARPAGHLPPPVLQPSFKILKNLKCQAHSSFNPYKNPIKLLS